MSPGVSSSEFSEPDDPVEMLYKDEERNVILRSTPKKSLKFVNSPSTTPGSDNLSRNSSIDEAMYSPTSIIIAGSLPKYLGESPSICEEIVHTRCLSRTYTQQQTKVSSVTRWPNLAALAQPLDHIPSPHPTPQRKRSVTDPSVHISSSNRSGLYTSALSIVAPEYRPGLPFLSVHSDNTTTGSSSTSESGKKKKKSKHKKSKNKTENQSYKTENQSYDGEAAAYSAAVASNPRQPTLSNSSNSLSPGGYAPQLQPGQKINIYSESAYPPAISPRYAFFDPVPPQYLPTRQSSTNERIRHIEHLLRQKIPVASTVGIMSIPSLSSPANLPTAKQVPPYKFHTQSTESPLSSATHSQSESSQRSPSPWRISSPFDVNSNDYASGYATSLQSTSHVRKSSFNNFAGHLNQYKNTYSNFPAANTGYMGGVSAYDKSPHPSPYDYSHSYHSGNPNVYVPVSSPRHSYYATQNIVNPYYHSSNFAAHSPLQAMFGSQVRHSRPAFPASMGPSPTDRSFVTDPSNNTYTTAELCRSRSSDEFREMNDSSATINAPSHQAEQGRSVSILPSNPEGLVPPSPVPLPSTEVNTGRSLSATKRRPAPISIPQTILSNEGAPPFAWPKKSPEIVRMPEEPQFIENKPGFWTGGTSISPSHPLYLSSVGPHQETVNTEVPQAGFAQVPHQQGLYVGVDPRTTHPSTVFTTQKADPYRPVNNPRASLQVVKNHAMGHLTTPSTFVQTNTASMYASPGPWGPTGASGFELDLNANTKMKGGKTGPSKSYSRGIMASPTPPLSSATSNPYIQGHWSRNLSGGVSPLSGAFEHIPQVVNGIAERAGGYSGYANVSTIDQASLRNRTESNDRYRSLSNQFHEFKARREGQQVMYTPPPHDVPNSAGQRPNPGRVTRTYQNHVPSRNAKMKAHFHPGPGSELSKIKATLSESDALFKEKLKQLDERRVV